MPTFPLCPQSHGQEGGFRFVTGNPNLPTVKVSYAMLVARKGRSIMGRMKNMVFGPLKAPTCGRRRGDLLWLASSPEASAVRKS